jgi:hypothetical protein
MEPSSIRTGARDADSRGSSAANAALQDCQQRRRALTAEKAPFLVLNSPIDEPSDAKARARPRDSTVLPMKIVREYTLSAARAACDDSGELTSFCSALNRRL